MFKTQIIFFTLLGTLILCYVQSAGAEKCNADDGKCAFMSLENVVNHVADGVPEFGIEVTDPFTVKFMKLNFLELIKAKLYNLKATGMRSCKVRKPNFTARRASADLLCSEFFGNAQYKISSTPALKNMIGDVHGNGTGSVAMEGLQFSFDVASEVKTINGKEYLIFNPNDQSYSFKVMNNFVASADNLYIGNQEISAVAVKIVNENWRTIAKNFGSIIMDKLMEVFYERVGKYYSNVPINEFDNTL